MTAAEQTQDAPPTGASEVDRCRDDVIVAALHLASIDWGNGLDTSSRAAALDDANERLDEALAAHTKAVIATYTHPCEEDS
jgi:hypothetical protein